MLSLAYLAIVTTLSHYKLLWLDELITFHIAQLGSVTAIWNALAHAADPNPPLTHFAVLASMRLFGSSELALRLPSILGYWTALLSLFLFLRRYVPVTWAVTGVLFSMANAAFDYSYESRSYAMMYGFTMLALLCWREAIDPLASIARHRLALCGMTLALALGVSTNYFAVLAFLPIAGGEVARTFFRWRRGAAKEIDLSIWLALTIAITPLLAFHPLIERSIAQFAPHAWNKVSLDQVCDAYLQMVEVILFPTLALLLLAGYLAVVSRHESKMPQRPQWIKRLVQHHGEEVLERHEAVAVFLLMAYPFLGYLVARLHGGMLSPRFVIPVCLGFSIAGTLAAFRIFGRLQHAGAISLALVACVFMGRVATVAHDYREQRQTFAQVLNDLPQAAAGLPHADKPIVVADPLMVLTLQHYAPPAVASRIVFPVDFPAIRSLRGEDSPEENLWAGRNTIYHLPIVPLADLQKNTADYVILASDNNWLVRDLATHSYPINRLPFRFPTETIEGFTPLNHADPVLYLSAGDRAARTNRCPEPTRFLARANLPDAPMRRFPSSIAHR
ncbi:MAG: glycosyltransferase family 39 protein [Edaphobacter sp.]|uniref:ArnT family glycosyltransferase n=1 Tax=Edaphobacter sp. TaxID=1934404 RepID=UPI0023A40C2D|nr:glycosyltransferase family 39 protein [Edaphobacter sp.]MDE1176794.1 glycosyltransferase family 39 protein [Edaphobacter sp.]